MEHKITVAETTSPAFTNVLALAKYVRLEVTDDLAKDGIEYTDGTLTLYFSSVADILRFLNGRHNNNLGDGV